MNLSDIDLRLLRVFQAVVEAGSFANAQNLLNISASTISTHMNQLESRVGFRLCERGRSGFELTPRGDVFHRHVLEFFGAVHTLQSQTQALRTSRAGHLRIGMIDNLATDLECPLHSALQHYFVQQGDGAKLSIQVMPPTEIEKRLLDHHIDLGLGIFYRTSAGLEYQHLYRERDVLVCGAHHPLASVTSPHALAHAIPKAPKVVRRFMRKQEFPFLEDEDESIAAAVNNVEEALFMILNGPLIGFLPRHFAHRWVQQGQLVELLPEKFVRYSQVMLVRAAQRPSDGEWLADFIRTLTVHVQPSSHP